MPPMARPLCILPTHETSSPVANRLAISLNRQRPPPRSRSPPGPGPCAPCPTAREPSGVSPLYRSALYRATIQRARGIVKPSRHQRRRQSKATELVDGGLDMAPAIREGDREVAGQQPFELQASQALERIGRLGDRHVGHVLEHDRAAPEDRIAAEQDRDGRARDEERDMAPAVAGRRDCLDPQAPDRCRPAVVESDVDGARLEPPFGRVEAGRPCRRSARRCSRRQLRSPRPRLVRRESPRRRSAGARPRRRRRGRGGSASGRRARSRQGRGRRRGAGAGRRRCPGPCPRR